MSEHARCGCGGEGDLFFDEPKCWHWVRCDRCGVRTINQGSALIAWASWDRAMSGPTIPSPSECRDPERLARIRPETVERWLSGRGWLRMPEMERGGWSRWFRHADGRIMTFVVAMNSGGALWYVAQVSDLWPHQLIAELEAMQTEEDGDGD